MYCFKSKLYWSWWSEHQSAQVLFEDHLVPVCARCNIWVRKFLHQTHKTVESRSEVKDLKKTCFVCHRRLWSLRKVERCSECPQNADFKEFIHASNVSFNFFLTNVCIYLKLYFTGIRCCYCRSRNMRWAILKEHFSYSRSICFHHTFTQFSTLKVLHIFFMFVIGSFSQIHAKIHCFIQLFINY